MSSHLFTGRSLVVFVLSLVADAARFRRGRVSCSCAALQNVLVIAELALDAAFDFDKLSYLAHGALARRHARDLARGAEQTLGLLCVCVLSWLACQTCCGARLGAVEAIVASFTGFEVDSASCCIRSGWAELAVVGLFFVVLS